MPERIAGGGWYRRAWHGHDVRESAAAAPRTLWPGVVGCSLVSINNIMFRFIDSHLVQSITTATATIIITATAITQGLALPTPPPPPSAP